MKKAVFLDRDGVINKERGDYTYKIEDFIINPGVVDCLNKLREMGYLLFVISNQGGIAKGLYNFFDVDNLHKHMLDFFKKHNIEIIEIYYCPHHEKDTRCLCRKPDSLMIEKALAKYKIDKKLSVLIGNSDRDIEAAVKAGIRGIKVESNLPLLQNSEIIELVGI